jgi:hypothetical protein
MHIFVLTTFLEIDREKLFRPNFFLLLIYALAYCSLLYRIYNYYYIIVYIHQKKKKPNSVFEKVSLKNVVFDPSCSFSNLYAL